MSLEKLIALHDKGKTDLSSTLDETELRKIGSKVYEEYMFDKNSRSEWDSLYQKVIKLAKQIYERKTFPWVGAANVKYPLLTNAAIQFASRQYPEIVQGDSVVHATAIGDDPTEESEDRANRIRMHMSSQLLVQSSSWEKNMDKLLHILPIVGTVFKKVYYDPIAKRNRTDLCTPDDIIINNDIPELKDARRITHIIYKHTNYIKSMMALGLFRKIDIQSLSEEGDVQDEDKLHEFLEQVRYLDLDKDGYQEPYIVTVHKVSQQVLRIASCWDMENVIVENDKLVAIKPTDYYVDYHFIPSPDGKYYSMGHGALLYPLNEVINSALNQLLDAGSLHNMQGGFIAKGVRIKNGELQINQGKWNIIDSNNMDLKNSIVPFPTKEPSPTLLKLVEIILAAGKDLASLNAIIQGQQDSQRAPVQTTLTLLKQGLVVPTAIQKRLYRSLTQEFYLLARLNRLYMSKEENFTYAGKLFHISQDDYKHTDIDIKPVADPNAASDVIRIQQIKAVMEIAKELPQSGQQALLQDYLKSLSIPSDRIKKYLTPGKEDKPGPEAVKMQAETEAIKMKAHDDMMDKQIKMLSIQQGDKKIELESMESVARTKKETAQASLAEAQSILALAQADAARAQIVVGMEKNKLDHYLGLLKSLDTENNAAAASAKMALTSLEENMNGSGNNNNQGGIPPMEGAPSNPQAIQAPPAPQGGSPENINGGELPVQ